ncbi:hypothetical protein E3E23_08175 [Thermococcus sp. CX2]|uniref:hypothetical protein n=1 Tax=Thermococcus sp. CX2 TaxID=163006 RepID=UPI00143BDE5F|nr:hypothetical protein [Thermococcus sp. CX2]NJE85796.1 hypothetical protein [Thermococcus sp. CX2]
MPYGHGFVYGLGAVYFLGFLLSLFIAGFFLSLAAHLVGIKEASTLKAMLAIVGGGIVGAVAYALVAVLLIWIAPMNVLLAVVVFILAYVWVIKTIFNTDWIRAFLAWILAAIIEVVVVGLLVLLGLVALA